MSNKVSVNILKRVYIVMGLMMIFCFAVVLQIGKIQFLESEKWLKKQEKERVFYKKTIADRGSILTEDGTILAITLPYYRIALDATVLKDENFPNFQDTLALLCDKLAKNFGRGELDSKYFKNKIIEARFNKDRHVYLFPMGYTFNFQELKKIMNLPIFRRGKKFESGLIVEKINNKRFYPYEDLAKITLGVLKDDTLGIRGLEYAYNAELRGKDGHVLMQKIAGGSEIPIEEFGQEESKDGFDIVTTLDVNFQDIVSTALRKGIEENEARGGVAIVMEVGTGKIKAIANYPENLNTAIASPLEPGSTFKIATTMAMLEDKAVNMQDSIDTGEGVQELYTLKMKDHAPYGRISLKTAFMKSSNIAFANIAEDAYGDKPERFIDALAKTGILKHTGAQIKGEPEPYVIQPSDRLWSRATLPWLSTGYNIKLTPLQICTFVNGIANNGHLISPVLVTRIQNNSEIFAQYKTHTIREKMCSSSTLATIQDFMLGVVENGTANNIQDPNYKIAGKTGTVQKYMNGKYQKKYRASFVGYFPADNPKYTCYVMIDEPSAGEIYGSRVAAPIFKEIADHIYYKDLEINQERYKYVENKKPQVPINRISYKKDIMTLYEHFNISAPEAPETDYVKAENKGKYVKLKEFTVNGKYVPNVKGMTAKDAVSLLENLGLRVKFSGHGRVKYQSISPGEPIPLNTKTLKIIHLTLE